MRRKQIVKTLVAVGTAFAFTSTLTAGSKGPTLERASAPAAISGANRSSLGFRLIRVGTDRAKIINGDGKVVAQSDPKIGIFGYDVSPDGTRISVYCGDAGSYVTTVGNANRRVLPQRPAGDYKFAFGEWRWLDNDRLVAISGDQKVNSVGSPVTTDDNVGQSRMYLYRLSAGTLSEIELPNELNGTVFSIGAVSRFGTIRLNLDSSSTDRNRRDWFKIAFQ